MSTTTTRSIQLEMTYTDFTTRNYKIPWKDNTTAETVISRIQAFNAAAATSGSSVKQTFVSNNGADVGGITDATSIIRTEEVIYSAQN